MRREPARAAKLFYTLGGRDSLVSRSTLGPLPVFNLIDREVRKLLAQAQAPGATPAQQKRAIVITLVAAIGLMLLLPILFLIAWFFFSLANELHSLP